VSTGVAGADGAGVLRAATVIAPDLVNEAARASTAEVHARVGAALVVGVTVTGVTVVVVIVVDGVVAAATDS
jgi:hypothetical protein